MSEANGARGYVEALALVDAAIERARAGDTTTALADVFAVLKDFPNDINILHKTGVTLCLSGASEQAIAHFHEALKVYPEFPFTLLELGNAHGDLGQWDQAFMWFERATRADPTNTLAYLRAGNSARMLGRYDRTLDLLTKGQAIDPDGFTINLELARELVFHDKRDAALPYYARAARLRPADATARLEYVNTLSHTGKYAQLIAELDALPVPTVEPFRFSMSVQRSHAELALRFDRDAIIKRAQARENGDCFLSPRETLNHLRGAIEARRPFSMTRHGDGEGRFFVLSGPPEKFGLTPESAAIIGESIWWNWFGETLPDADHAEIPRLRGEFEQAIANSDILGLPLASRLDRDPQHFGYLAALEDQVARISLDQHGVRVTDSLAHIALHRISPYYHDLLAGLPFLGVIGPHGDLAPRLAARFGIGTFRTYSVPGEMRLPGQRRRSASDRHFPDRFRATMAMLHVPFRGAVFLVAAGLLGKVYCNRIKSLGGIAIDIGSVADAWAGHNTRPGQFDNITEWKLPD